MDKHYLAKFGFTIEQFENKKNSLSQIPSSDLSDHNVMLKLFSEKLEQTKNYSELKRLYFSLALCMAGFDKPFFHYLYESQKAELLNFREKGLYKYVILQCGAKCNTCKQSNGQRLTIEEALKMMPLPNKKCTNKIYNRIEGWCICWYAPDIQEAMKRL